MSEHIIINEVGPRDGLQSQDKHLDVDERHTGSIVLPVVGAADFDIQLEQERSFGYTMGANLHLMHNMEAAIEVGFGAGREYANLTMTMRF